MREHPVYLPPHTLCPELHFPFLSNVAQLHPIPPPTLLHTRPETSTQSQRRRPLQPNTIPHKKLIQKMLMPNPRRSTPRKLVNSLLHTIPLLLNQIAANEEARTVEAIVAMHPDQSFLALVCG